MKRIFLFLIVAGVFYLAKAQTLTLTDQETGQPLIGATIHSDSPKAEAISNEKGQIDLAEFKGSEAILIRMIGYQLLTKSYEELFSDNFAIKLLLTGVPLNELVISASKFEEIQGDVIQKIQVIRKSDLQQMNQTSMADVLQQSGNIMVQKSQQGGGSPIIRGFETNKVLLVVDGVRMNNAIYRGGHLQNVVTLDNAIMDRVEVVFGPGSTMYGSDALGGVVHFYTKNPTLSTDESTKVMTLAYQRYMSASDGLASHVDVSVGGKKWGSLSSVTYSNFGDLEQGNSRNPFYRNFGKRDWYAKRVNGTDVLIENQNPDVQVGSAYKQYDFLQKVLFKPNAQSEHLLNIQYSTSSDVLRYDRLTQLSNGSPRYAEWYYGPQKRFFSAYSFNLKKSTALFDRAKFTAGYQQIEESRNDRRFGNDALNHRIENVDVFTLNADLFKLIGEHELRYGAELTYNDVTSTAFQEDITTNTRSELDTRYPDGGSSMKSAAIYFTHTWEINEKWILTDGVRLSYVGLNATFKDKTFFPFPFDDIKQQSTAPSGNLGLAFKPGADWRLTGNISAGFRAPNVDDLSKVFESVQGRIVVPNPDLKPEYTINKELNISKTFDNRINASVTGYHTTLRNALTVLPSTFNGSSTVIYDGEVSDITTTKNASEAYIYGFETAIAGNITESFSVRGSLNYTYGRIRTDTTDYPLDHIAPVFGKVHMQLKTGKFKNEFFTQFSGWKRIKNYNLIGEDNFNYATEQGMPAWFTLNARTTWTINKSMSLQVACENMLDQNYRVFASNISAPGRNWVLTLRGNF